MKDSTNHQTIKTYPKYLWFLILSYTAVILLANWFDIRFVRLFSLITDAGTIIFPLTFLLSDIITEVYGYKNARRAIWCGFLFNLLFIAYGQLITHLPSPQFHTMNPVFDKLMGFNTRIIIASIISYFISEPVNSIVLSKLKIILKGRYMWARFVGSTVIASGLDSTIFSLLAFYKVIPSNALITMILTMWLIKVCVEIIGLPFSMWCARKLKRAEGLDIYDWHTNYTLFAFNANYQKSNNEYNKPL